MFKQTIEIRQSPYMDEDEKNPIGVGASKAAMDRMVEK